MLYLSHKMLLVTAILARPSSPADAPEQHRQRVDGCTMPSLVTIKCMQLRPTGPWATPSRDMLHFAFPANASPVRICNIAQSKLGALIFT
jgi:hypothetical protein